MTILRTVVRRPNQLDSVFVAVVDDVDMELFGYVGPIVDALTSVMGPQPYHEVYVSDRWPFQNCFVIPDVVTIVSWEVDENG